MKKRILSLLLALVTVFYIIPFGAFPVIALDGDDEEESYLTIEDLEVGKLYSAKFSSDEFVPCARYLFVDSHEALGKMPSTLDGTLPKELLVERDSAADFGLVRISSATANWPAEYEEFRYVSASLLKIGGGTVTLENMTAGTPYMAQWNQTAIVSDDENEKNEDGLVLLYKDIAEADSNYFVDYSHGKSDADYLFSTNGFPKDLIIELVYEEDGFVRVTNTDWPAEYEQYRYLEAEYDLIITGEYNPTDDGYIYGKVGIFCESANGNTLTLKQGEKAEAFTELDEGITSEARFQWEMKIEGDEWAIVKDAILSYITISEALVANTVGEYATLRCIVTDGTKKYASDELKVKIQPEMTVHYGGANGAQQFADGLSNQPATAADSSVFQACINYKFVHTREDINGTNAFAPFIHTFYSNSDTLSATIYSQLRVGYTACVVDPEGDIEYNGVKYTAKPLHKFDNVNILSPYEDLNITIYYVPNLMGFNVEYYEQNLADDSYTRAGQVRKEGYTDDFIGTGLAEPRTGFKALFYDPELTIAGNGATVIEIYYDRIYYLVDFELQDGYGITPYYVRYGTQVMLTEPTRPGHSFKKPWILTRVYSVTEDELGNKTEKDINFADDAELMAAYSGKDAGAIIVVRNNITYTANWDVGTTSYTIIYWLENADDTNFTLHSFKEVKNVAPGTYASATDSLDLDGTEENHFVFMDAISDKNVEVKGDGTTAVNAYYARKYYTINFKSSGTTCVLGGNYSHTHGTNCECDLLCTQETHTHTDACGDKTFVCTLEEHTSHTTACCSITSNGHTHTPACYGSSSVVDTTPTTNLNNAPKNAQEGQIYRSNSGGSSRYYIYINGSWYRYRASTNNAIISPSTESCPTVHISSDHTTGDCSYSDALHTHNDNCYEYSSCNNTMHIHNDGCYGECKLYVHTCNGTCRNNSTNNVKIVTQKYDSDISKIWPIVGDNGVSYSGQVWKSSITNNWYSILYKVPGQDLTMTSGTIGTGATLRWYYALERLTPTTEYDGNTYVEDGTRYYYVAFSTTITATNGTNLTYDEDYFPITGFQQRDLEGNWDASDWVTNNGVREMYLYYVRNDHDLIFYDGENTIKTLNFLYEASLKDAYFIPDTIPASKENGSVEFAGWYTTSTCADGTEFDFDNEIMPDRDVTLYAKWIPKEYDVQVYRQESEIGSTITGQLLYDAVLPFNTQVREEDLAKYVIPQENYVFSGWYYVVDGVEKRYDFNTMLIKGETVIYAKWTKNIQIPYTVLYLFNEGTVESPEWVEIAERTEGYSLAGISKTFTAKMGIKLYEEYQSWYFPASRYYTHVMSEDFSANVIRFEYQKNTEIEYTILHKFQSEKLKTQYGGYFPDGTFQLVIHDSINASENNFTTTVIERYNDEITLARVTEALETKVNSSDDIEGIYNILTSLTADYYVQEMVLTLEPTQNVMVFNWFESNTTKTYHIIHYLQAPDRSTYSVYSSVNHTVQNDSNYEIIEEWDNPFGYVRKEVKISGVAKGEFLNQDQVNITLGQFGQDATIEFYYDRAQYTYTIHHYINGTSIRIADDQTGTAYYEDKVRVGEVDLNDVVGYIIANPNDVKEITAADQEIICFYNSMSVYYLFQEAISGRGIISKPTYEGHVGILPEQDEAMITATARDGYRFIGWYLDKAGTQSVEQYANVYGEGGASIMPKTPTPDMANQTITFYALFEPTTRVFKNEGVADESQAFIYRIEGIDTANSNVDVTFVITGNGSVTLAMLPYGNYRITVLNWAWRYGLPNGMVENSVEVNINTAEPFTFVYSGTPTDKWLTDDASGTVTP